MHTGLYIFFLKKKKKITKQDKKIEKLEPLKQIFDLKILQLYF